MRKINNFINNLKIGYKNRSTYIKITLSNENLKIIQYFYKYNWIKNYIIKNKKIYVYLRYIENKPLIQNIILNSTKGYRKYLNIENLKKKQYILVVQL